MAVWSEWKSPSADPVDGDWDFFVSDGTFVMKKLVNGEWVDVASWSAGGVGPAGSADKVDGKHASEFEPTIASKGTAFNKDFAGSGSATTVARSDHTHSGFAGLTNSYHKFYDAASLSAGEYVIDASSYVASGATAAFVWWRGVGTAAINIRDNTSYNVYSQNVGVSGDNYMNGGCIVPLDANKKFNLLVVSGSVTDFTLCMTYSG